MLVEGKQMIAHYLVLFVHQYLFISPLLFVSPETAWKLPIRRGDWGEKESLFHCAIFPPSLRFFVPTMQAICDPKSGCSSTQALWTQHLMITHIPNNKPLHDCHIQLTWKWLPDFHISFIFFLKVMHLPFPFTWRFQDMVFFPDLENQSVNNETFFDNDFRFPECCVNHKMKFPDFSVTFQLIFPDLT